MEVIVSNLTAEDRAGVRTVSGTVGGVARSASLPSAMLDALPLEASIELFKGEFRRQLDAEPRPYPLPFSEIVVEV